MFIISFISLSFFFRFYSLRLSKWNEQRNKKRKEKKRTDITCGWSISLLIFKINQWEKKKGGKVGNKIKKKKKKKNNRELNKIKKKETT